MVEQWVVLRAWILGQQHGWKEHRFPLFVHFCFPIYFFLFLCLLFFFLEKNNLFIIMIF